MAYRYRKTKGGGGIATVWVLFLIFAPGVFIAISNEEITGALISAVFAFICLLIIIAYYALRPSTSQNTSEYDDIDARRHKREAERIAALPNYFETKISEDSFKGIKDTISSINGFLVYLISNGFYQWLDQQNIAISAKTDSYKLSTYMILSDIKTALVGMGSSMDMKSKEGLAVFLAVNALNSNEDVEFGMLKLMKDETIKPAEDLINGAYNIFNKKNNPDKLVFADLLKSYNRDIQLQYLIDTLFKGKVDADHPLPGAIEECGELIDRARPLLVAWRKSTKLIT